MNGVYSLRHRVCNADTDMFMRLRTSAMFQLLQEASIRHSEELGVGRARTLDRGILWVVTLQHAEINRMPEYDEWITVETWPGKTMYCLFPRYYRILDESGKVLINASAIWTHIDRETRKMVPPQKSGIAVDEVVTGHEIALPAIPASLPTEFEAEYTVPYSYIDLNRHLNNVHYYDIAENYLEAARSGRQLRAVSAEYAGELHLDDRLKLRIGSASNRCYVLGEIDKKMFALSLEYEKETE